jgi:hypothetical protein
MMSQITVRFRNGYAMRHEVDNARTCPATSAIITKHVELLSLICLRERLLDAMKYPAAGSTL